MSVSRTSYLFCKHCALLVLSIETLDMHRTVDVSKICITPLCLHFDGNTISLIWPTSMCCIMNENFQSSMSLPTWFWNCLWTKQGRQSRWLPYIKPGCIVSAGRFAMKQLPFEYRYGSGFWKVCLSRPNCWCDQGWSCSRDRSAYKNTPLGNTKTLILYLWILTIITMWASFFLLVCHSEKKLHLIL